MPRAAPFAQLEYYCQHHDLNERVSSALLVVLLKCALISYQTRYYSDIIDTD